MEIVCKLKYLQEWGQETSMCKYYTCYRAIVMWYLYEFRSERLIRYGVPYIL